MTIKQRITICALVSAVFIIDGLFIVWLSPTKGQMPLALITAWTFITGISLGMKIHKWERDKEMAWIVAERLLGKPKVHSVDVISAGSGYAQTISSASAMLAQQQAIAMGKSINGLLGASGTGGAGLGNSLLGSPTSSHDIKIERFKEQA